MRKNTATANEAGESEGRSRLALAQTEFDPDVVYLNTASMGLPPRRSLDALHGTLEDWRTGWGYLPAEGWGRARRRTTLRSRHPGPPSPG